jgi:hypothetical protein
MMMNSPQKTRTPQSIAKSVLLFLRSDIGNKRICILIEGPDDAKIYPRFFKDIKTKVMFIKSKGKPKMEESLQILSITSKRKQAIGICDADFSHLDRVYPSIANVFLTDYHDIEMTMLHFTDVFCNAWSIFFLQDDTEEIMSDVLHNAAYMAYIRWYNQKNQCNLSFKALDFTRFFKVQNGKIVQDSKMILDTLNQRSRKKTKSLTNKEINIFIQGNQQPRRKRTGYVVLVRYLTQGPYPRFRPKGPGYGPFATNQTDDVFNLCNGHDVTALIALILEEKTKENVSRENYCDVLRGCFQLNHFMQTRLYGNLLAWQETSGFDILKTEPGAANG